MEKKNQWNTGYWIVALLLLLSLQSYWQTAKTVEPVPYSEFEKALDEGRVAEVLVSDRTVTGRLKSPDSRGKTTIVATRVEPDLDDRLSKYDVPYARVLESTWLRDVLSWILPAVSFFGVWFFLFRRFAEKQGMGGFLNIGKSRAKMFVEKNTVVTFADVAGGDEAKAELVEIVDFLKNPQDYGRLGARIPKGVLLVGPPGTGKTLLAKAVAGEAAVPFFSISGSEFVEMFVGVGAARVRDLRDLFEQARGQAPAIIFIDELDALGRARGVGGPIGGHDEREQTLNQLLTEMDGFDSSVGLIILAATNSPEILDQALLRAGRFDRQVLVDRPDKKGRLDILKVHVKKVTLAQDVDLEQVAALTTGFSGADLANLVNEAALAARRRRASAVELQDFTATIERIVAGLEKKSRVLNPKERETVAHHEMGHALVLPETDPVHKISIIPRGIGALGYTLQRPTEDRFLMTRTDLEHKIAVLLGGRAAEKLVFGELSTGAADDLARATDIARDMITRFGMDEGLGYIAFEAQRPRFLYTPELAHGGCRVAESTQARIDQAIRDIVMGVFEHAYRILDINRAVLERCARELLARETLDESDIRQLTQGLVRN
ncbi:TPA: ATP-dependent zinc metalloprotease FtsH [Escherichia coli]|uniref:ATP-dependent zinc metalloprotease FtsH n=1 Tax=Enterobacteriaceae TaxID=543 RepID=UPI000DD6C322|nr:MULTISPECIES: ATP-dependent zinc metalloprotease FtsH [Enterobacteriaceae]EID2896291.1 ATP-dependent zinc metalloprotease FtsH [Escherichia coli]MCA7566009.1 ATP-dependent zinc metalloprotease FtsH [Escherichia coli]MCF1286191.1 ATP-dependent zinc metalloprotease FtsH [Enterobacter kobei]MCX3861112.1 ATP-dependent zinc metalloprotease FtsH [Escherichia coli]MDD8084143.1 ATP-dependent zinc metalloprotease FtsH [Escherichia coli]